MTPEGIALIKKYEGLRLKAYLCPAGVPTIGYGTIRVKGVPVVLGMSCSESDADKWLQLEIDKKESNILKMVTANINKNMLAALVSFVYNLGEGALRNSTLLVKLNSGDFATAANEFLKWNKVKDPKTGKFSALSGLTKRRQDERTLFLTPVGS